MSSRSQTKTTLTTLLTNSESDVVLTREPNGAPIEVMRQIIFAVNLLEDIRQDVAGHLKIAVPKVSTIFEMVPDVSLIANSIRRARFSS